VFPPKQKKKQSSKNSQNPREIEKK